MKNNIRDLVKELLENEYLIVSYNELENGGFDLSVRINDTALNTAGEKPDKDTEDYLKEFSRYYNPIRCPYCGSINNIRSIYNVIDHKIHYLCENCQKEFNV